MQDFPGSTSDLYESPDCSSSHGMSKGFFHLIDYGICCDVGIFRKFSRWFSWTKLWHIRNRFTVGGRFLSRSVTCPMDKSQGGCPACFHGALDRGACYWLNVCITQKFMSKLDPQCHSVKGGAFRRLLGLESSGSTMGLTALWEALREWVQHPLPTTHLFLASSVPLVMWKQCLFLLDFAAIGTVLVPFFFSFFFWQ
jgi:hypothetical protein